AIVCRGSSARSSSRDVYSLRPGPTNIAEGPGRVHQHPDPDIDGAADRLRPLIEANQNKTDRAQFEVQRGRAQPSRSSTREAQPMRRHRCAGPTANSPKGKL